MGKNNNWIIAVVVIGFIAISAGWINLNLPTESAVSTSNNQQGQGVGYATTVSVKGYNPMNGSLAFANAEILQADGSAKVGETSVPGAITAVSTSMPNSFNGFVMLGNDNYVSTTDRGADSYYTKTALVYANSGSPDVVTVNTPTEGTLTWVGYDDGTAETLLNVTVGTSEISTTELKMTVSAGGVYGNPQLDNPIAVCFNASSDTAGTKAYFDYIKPVNYVSEIDPPGFLATQNIIAGKCYVLPTGALSDVSATGAGSSNLFYRFYVRIKPASGLNPSTTTDAIDVIALDKTYYKNEQSVWVSGFGVEKSLGADTDVGSADIAQATSITLA
jgi:hypothetical protein